MTTTDYTDRMDEIVAGLEWEMHELKTRFHQTIKLADSLLNAVIETDSLPDEAIANARHMLESMRAELK